MAGAEPEWMMVRQMGTMQMGLSIRPILMGRLQFAQGTLPGLRTPGNDDAVLVTAIPDTGPAAGLLCVVADGVGGLPNGAQAARTAVQTMAASLTRGPQTLAEWDGALR